MKKENKNPTTNLEGNANLIWNEIKNKKIDMFAIPNQTVENYCVPVEIEPSKLYLLTKASAVLPSLEVALGDAYKVEQVTKYLVVSKV